MFISILVLAPMLATGADITIEVTVRDESGTAIVDATVTIRDPANSLGAITHPGLTDSKGKVRFDIPESTREISIFVDRQGYTRLRQKEVIKSSGRNAFTCILGQELSRTDIHFGPRHEVPTASLSPPVPGYQRFDKWAWDPTGCHKVHAGYVWMAPSVAAALNRQACQQWKLCERCQPVEECACSRPTVIQPMPE